MSTAQTTGRVAVITGASSGIARLADRIHALAGELARRGSPSSRVTVPRRLPVQGGTVPPQGQRGH
jgi:NADP-dependent 3-hydroxy acid dehydrogenase YdfG